MPDASDDRRGPARAYIGLGANLGAPRVAIDGAIHALDRLPSTRVVRASALYRTAPIDAGGDDYVNAAVALDTALEPLELLDALQRIEAAHGRVRTFRNAPRTLDLDLLVYDDRRLSSERLTLPHPRLHERAFVLVPLAEIAPGLEVPGLGFIDHLLPGVAGQRIDKL